MLTPLVEKARELGASDLHLEPGLAATLRIRGALKPLGDRPMGGERLLASARELLGPQGWADFLARRSADISVPIAGVSCRINIFQTARGVGMALRLLAAVTPSLEQLNLMPELGDLVEGDCGLVLITGPTGSGKSSTMAALIEHINRRRPVHILTLEAPIEYQFTSQKAFIRQREVGRDTPSFEQALLDALREDPDVIMVGEMRRRETMQLTLDAAETGHLVLATMHASSISEALQRIVSSFPAASQAAVRGQLADCFVAGVSQQLVYHPRHQLRIPECEIVTTTTAVRANIRDGAFFKLPNVVSTGASDGMWSVERYRRWVADLTEVQRPPKAAPAPPAPVEASVHLPPLGAASAAPVPVAAPVQTGDDAICIEDASSLDDVIAQLEER